MSKKEFTKNQIHTLADFVNKKGNTMTITDIANVSETIKGIIEGLKDIDEDEFPSKDDVICTLSNLRSVMRETPYFNLVSTIFGELQVIITYYFE